jgi:hypothetical protein
MSTGPLAKTIKTLFRPVNIIINYYLSRSSTSENMVNIIDLYDSKPLEDRPACYFSL